MKTMDPIPTYLRERMVKAVEEGASVAEVASRFAVSDNTVRNFVRLAKEGALKPKPRSGGPGTALDEADRERLVEAVDQRPDATLQELVDECGLNVSISTVSRELAKLDRPRKRKVRRASEQSEKAVQKQRRQWRSETRRVDAKHLVFVDETAIATNMTRAYGRAPANERVYTDVSYRQYESLTVLGAMRLGGAGDFPTMVYKGGTTTDRMVEYVAGPLGEVLRPGDIVVADRLGAHTAKRVAEAIAEQKAEIRLLPPYSPDLNPIERLWSKTKTFLRAAKATTVDGLRSVLQKALKTVANSDIRNWIAHSNYLVPT
jgi:transposase